jgi:mono/diheme cytochrome c family protein
MTMRWKAIACAVTLGVAAVVAASAQTPTTADRTLDGTYSADQARRGRAVYDSKCASCHDGGTMGPKLWASPFWRSGTANRSPRLPAAITPPRIARVGVKMSW